MNKVIFLTIVIFFAIFIESQAYSSSNENLSSETQQENLNEYNENNLSKRNMSELKIKKNCLFHLIYLFFKDVCGNCVAGL